MTVAVRAIAGDAREIVLAIAGAVLVPAEAAAKDAAGAAAVLVPARGPAVAVLEVVRAVVPVAAIPAPALVLAPAQDSATPLVRPKRRQRK